MNEKLNNLSGSEKKAVIGLACQVSAQAHDSCFRTNDPETDIILQECFSSHWVGFWNTDYRHLYLIEAVTSDMDQNIAIVSELDTDVKYAVKNLLIKVMGDNVMAMLTASEIVQQIGLPTIPTPSYKKCTKIEKNTQEDDGTFKIDAVYARLTDVNAVRESDKVYTLKEDVEDPGVKVGANYNAWKSLGVCPTNGVVGYYNPKVNKETDEGTLYLLFCTGNLIIPVLEWGLEKLDEWDYREKCQNNKMLAFDKSGKRCEALRRMKKNSSPRYNIESTTAPDKKVVHFMATVLQRLEPGKLSRPSYTQRQIKLTYTKNGSHLELEVVGVVRPHNAKFENDDGRIITYRDTTNRHYYYEVETQPRDNSIVRVSLFRPNDSFDNHIEYRYTV